MYALILNDTRGHGHLGCGLVMNQLLAGCSTAGIHPYRVLRQGRGHLAAVRRALPKADIVIINGEGTMHHDQPSAQSLAEAGILAHQMGKPLALINTVWEQNSLVNTLLPCAKLIYARESRSAAQIRQAGYLSMVAPDLSLTTPPHLVFQTQKACGSQVVVLDDVRWDLTLLLARFAKKHGFPFFRMAGRPSLRSRPSLQAWGDLFCEGALGSSLNKRNITAIYQSEIIVTGRFHGACLAILAGRPFLALPSNTHKIHGMLEDADLGVCARMLDLENPTENQLAEAVTAFREQVSDSAVQWAFREACQKYIKRAHREAKCMFNAIRDIR
ncbi:MAG: Polysaccharide pyruvyl transferase [Holophagaceae bacterium]|nr:Polysaccharide pyruvyl transferase [Holophagaceae bacterium]